jgi:hypothetical protein
MPANISIRFMQELEYGIDRTTMPRPTATSFLMPDACISGNLVDLKGQGLSIGH